MSEADLDAIPAFGKLLISREMSRPLDHAAALEECKRLAHLWLNSDDAQLPNTSLTGSFLPFVGLLGHQGPPSQLP